MVFSNNLLFGAAAATSGGAAFDTTLIPNSVWLDGSADFLSAELGAKTRTKAVIGTWFQKTGFTTSDATIFSKKGSAHFAMRMQDQASKAGLISIFDHDGSNFQYLAESSGMVLRDIGWYHIMLSIDTTAAGGSRLKYFINGIDQTSTLTISTDYTASDNPSITGGSGEPTQWGVGPGGSSQFSPMYLAQSFMLDDDSIQNSDVAVSDILDSFTYGTNGSQFVPKANADIATLASSAGGDSFCLDFANSSDLGNDVSSNNNDFTPTSMAAVNQSTNTPSNVYCTFNVLQPSSSTMVFSEGNLRVTANAGGDGGAIGTLPMSTTGTTEFQVKTNNGDGRVGITCLENLQNVAPVSDRVISGGVFSYDAGYALVEEGRKQVVLASGRTDTAGFGPSWSSGDVITVRYNADDNELNFLVNNSAVSGGTITTVAGLTYYPFIGRNDNYDMTGFFDSSDFPHTIGSGNLEVNSANVTAPEFQGADHFNAVVYEGSGSEQTIGSGESDSNFTALAWIKNRDAADDNIWMDRIIGTGGYLSTTQNDSGTAATAHGSGGSDVLTSEAQAVKTFGMRSVTIGTMNEVNTSGESYVLWQWLLGTSATSAGSITTGSPTLTTTGLVADTNHFSIVQYTGNGLLNATFAHGLGAAPNLIIIKRRSGAALNSDWMIHNDAIDISKNNTFPHYRISTNTGGTTGNIEATGNDLVQLGTSVATNKSSETHMAYCFRNTPGVFKAGVYIGNSSTNGAYVSVGFKPKFVWIWNTTLTSSAAARPIIDTARYTFNGSTSAGGTNGGVVFTDNRTAEEAMNTSLGVNPAIDILADGFKLRANDSTINTGTAYGYICMADIGGNGTLPPIYGR